MIRVKKFKGKKRSIPILGRLSPEKNTYDFFWQKSLGGGRLFDLSWKFKPSEYLGESPEEKKKNAYEDARNHANFYKELVRKGVYPEGTRIKVKRKRNSDAYIVEFFMPEIKTLDYLDEKNENLDLISRRLNKREKERLRPEVKRIENIIINTYNKRVENPKGWVRLDKDMNCLRNYGIDDKGKLRYIDTETITENLPYHNKKTDEEITNERRRKLEGIVGSILLITMGILIPASMTGKVISNIRIIQNNITGIILFLFLIIIFSIILKKI